ncbi:equilibrative nucleoside transporter 1a [Puntigrus tetrazona]|uniref:equilibrative nucleoside transporter 1a n=1 Tax=Puntigrus tetrazona TaxID=1606681 RepID=UPI001C8AF7D4|nr:equilibrative nucleoside transporter 1a [Puntigrus tetrazona]XP_043111869.1 equilibrative nucleoside transporter 1a [Puntigrus tetrazona]XP_043111870.1 equilibrative nucleoside transporter 1a [Puntigrus tetrazona]
MTAANAPRDRYNAVWIIFFILGLGTLLPWNFFMTATMYFTSRLKDPQTSGEHNLTSNVTVVTGDRNVLESKFNNVMTLCAMVPLLIFTCLNSFIHQRIPQKLRISGSLSVIFVVFLITAVLVKVEMEPLPFFTLTMIKIICINSFGAILQGSLFGLAGMLPASYTTPIMSGQGLAGTFAAFSMICALASGSELQDSAFGYFITACVVILLAIVSYLALPKMEFFQYYSESNGSRSSTDEENKMDLLKPEGEAEKRPVLSLTDEASRPAVSVFGIFKQIWVMALSVCFVFTITIGVFPAVTVDVKTTVVEGGSSWNIYFIPVSCFLLFNVMDWAGRSLTAVCMWPGKNSIWLPILVVARLVFVPLFMFCNVQPRSLPVAFAHDAWYIVFMILFSFSNGYLASLCMCFGPKKVSQHEAETAGAIMAFFLSLGLAVGAALSFAFRAMI